ncbi:glycine-rich domain-containing protein [Streptomyces johnsoniae]|uniref:Uncharacterized protein n=1 Tax=Streptomyces johnsoniae TaxID=3075532 RepID=A0ABU2RYB3_9ACTN|nr:hypothetical protein [Streptomyces sp. DSM 41886]MDT0441199.1 hypothetical protein [Streptomyces sp. DSM 41886]
MSTTTVAPRTGRDLLTDREFAAVTATVRGNNPGMREPLAQRIVSQGAAFVGAAAVTEHTISPSRTVDEGWHALILHTRIYQRLCDRAGRFVHHVPQAPDSGRFDTAWRDRAMDAIRAAGFEVDEELWRPPGDRTVDVAAQCQHRPPTCDDAPCEAQDCDASPN